MPDTTALNPSKERAFDNFERSYREFLEASDLTRPEKAARLASQIDLLSLTREGLSFLFRKSKELDQSDFFKDSAWNDPRKLVPGLVRGTMKAGHPSSSFEILSELRMLAYTRSGTSEITKEEAHSYLEEVVVHNLDLALKVTSEETRESFSERELKKAFNLFGFLVSEMDLKGITEKLSEEIQMICKQRPVVTEKVRSLLHLVGHKFDLKGNSSHEKRLLLYVNAVYGPSPETLKRPSNEDYARFLNKCKEQVLEKEAHAMGKSMGSTGLVSQYHAILLTYLLSHPKYEHLVPPCLNLNDRGIAEWNKHNDFLRPLMLETVGIYNAQCIYGLARMLGRNLLSRRPVRVGLENLRRIQINPQVENRILKSNHDNRGNVTAIQYLMGALIRVLGQPLGVGQGNNPTCQSARGISMWSQHAPAKLIDMVITVATKNNLVMRFENHDLVSNQLGKGLVEKLDYDLDGVSIVLVPHLDKIYNEMMRRASGRGEDPHKWVNPAMYGHWIQLGFASAYDYLTNSIVDFKGFLRIFYKSFHPEFNNGRQLSYPSPVGIIITSSSGEMVGFHAISLLRVDKSPGGELRAYFLNPNNEGRQDWGQEIKPTVHGNGEKHGESSLRFEHFASRVYAFHYNTLDVDPGLFVDDKVVGIVENLARQSWGKSYTWNQQTKLW
ncbi:MAG: hypothetical protein KI791_13825 [Cyclobacteriaceae bacterium]|nr:hypothetical protein [Cyclobacteriaceae bacterium SS2]